MFAVLPAALAGAVAAAVAVVSLPGPARGSRAGPGPAAANTSAWPAAARYISQHQSLPRGECSAAQLSVPETIHTTRWDEVPQVSTLGTQLWFVFVKVRNRGRGCTFVVPHQIRVKTRDGSTHLVPLVRESPLRYRIPHGAHKTINLGESWPVGAPPNLGKCDRPVRDVTGVIIGNGPAAISVALAYQPWPELCQAPAAGDMFVTPPQIG